MPRKTVEARLREVPVFGVLGAGDEGFDVVYMSEREARQQCDSSSRIGGVPLDTVYFLTVTSTTVGYGDFIGETSSRWFTAVVVQLIGSTMIFTLIGSCVNDLLQALEGAFWRCMCMCRQGDLPEAADGQKGARSNGGGGNGGGGLGGREGGGNGGGGADGGGDDGGHGGGGVEDRR
ncbi:MAG: potassium channel family protein, partial [Pseudomonadota bacterium]|nr:potassium channel family protein [Pseudomonadota bacterium]